MSQGKGLLGMMENIINKAKGKKKELKRFDYSFNIDSAKAHIKQFGEAYVWSWGHTKMVKSVQHAKDFFKSTEEKELKRREVIGPNGHINHDVVAKMKKYFRSIGIRVYNDKHVTEYLRRGVHGNYADL